MNEFQKVWQKCIYYEISISQLLIFYQLRSFKVLTVKGLFLFLFIFSLFLSTQEQ